MLLTCQKRTIQTKQAASTNDVNKHRKLIVFGQSAFFFIVWYYFLQKGLVLTGIMEWRAG